MRKKFTIAVCILAGILFSVLPSAWAESEKELKKQLDLADDITEAVDLVDF